MIERHHTALVHHERVGVAHRVRGVEGVVCHGVIREHDVLHAYKEEREVGPESSSMIKAGNVKRGIHPVNRRAHVEYAVTA